MTNKSGTLYIGVTNNIIRRGHQHKLKVSSSFTSKYNINKLIYIEEYSDAREAISREKQLKGWTRKKKINLIKNMNPEFGEIRLT